VRAPLGDGGRDYGQEEASWWPQQWASWHAQQLKVPSLVLANWWNLGLTFVSKWMI
jgi:hypothetical protein